MAETKTISPELMTKLQQLQEQFDLITKRYGELRFAQLMTETEMEQLSTGMVNLESERTAMVVKIQEEFGSTGAVNLQTGEFIPD